MFRLLAIPQDVAEPEQPEEPAEPIQTVISVPEQALIQHVYVSEVQIIEDGASNSYPEYNSDEPSTTGVGFNVNFDKNLNI